MPQIYERTKREKRPDISVECLSIISGTEHPAIYQIPKDKSILTWDLCSNRDTDTSCITHFLQICITSLHYSFFKSYNLSVKDFRRYRYLNNSYSFCLYFAYRKTTFLLLT